MSDVTINGKAVREILEELSKPLPESARQKALLSSVRGYDADGFGYQFLADRLNEVVGLANWRCVSEVVSLRESESSKGKHIYCLTVKASVTITADSGEVTAFRECYGGHSSNLEYDAYKGAFTNAFKKTVALFGLGASAYRGTIDDDLLPDEESTHKVLTGKDTAKKPDTNDNDMLKTSGIEYAYKEVNGVKCLVVTKNTYEKRTLLKSMGFKFHMDEKVWYKQAA